MSEMLTYFSWIQFPSIKPSTDPFPYTKELDWDKLNCWKLRAKRQTCTVEQVFKPQGAEARAKLYDKKNPENLGM